MLRYYEPYQAEPKLANKKINSYKQHEIFDHIVNLPKLHIHKSLFEEYGKRQEEKRKKNSKRNQSVTRRRPQRSQQFPYLNSKKSVSPSPMKKLSSYKKKLSPTLKNFI